MSDYDGIVIGSGAGGMTAAVALANAGHKILVLEQHYVPGGWTHSFTINGYRFSPGVHYIGDLGPDELLHRIYRGLGISKDLSFRQIHPSGYEHFWIGNQKFDVPTGREAYAHALIQRFPNEKEGILQVLEIYRLMGQGFRDLVKAQNNPRHLAKALLPILKYGLKPLQKTLDRSLRDPYLKAFLSAQGGVYGLPPRKALTVMHGLIQEHYINGAYYPIGGAFKIPRAYLRQLKRKGGTLKLKSKVSKIVIRKHRAVGVHLSDGTEISAKYIVSNADPEVTFRQLIGEEALPWHLKRKLNKTLYGPACLSLYLATDLDLPKLGYDSGNYAFMATPDLNAIYDFKRFPKPGFVDPKAHFDTLFASISTLKDGRRTPHGHHTIEAFIFVPYQPFARWEGTEIGKRGPDYEAYKRSLGRMLLNTLEKIFPEIQKHIQFMEVGTPLTNLSYVMSTQGSAYGTLKIGSQLGPFAYPVKTAIPGLYMVGASTLGHGIAGVTQSGLAAARTILKASMREILNQQGPPMDILPEFKP